MKSNNLPRAVAVALVVVVTLCGLKGIAALAHADAELPVITLPRVEVIAPKNGAEHHAVIDSPQHTART